MFNRARGCSWDRNRDNCENCRGFSRGSEDIRAVAYSALDRPEVFFGSTAFAAREINGAYAWVAFRQRTRAGALERKSRLSPWAPRSRLETFEPFTVQTLRDLYRDTIDARRGGGLRVTNAHSLR